jgi:hypothetical protein
MKVNVASIAKVKTTRTVSPTEIALLLKDIVGKSNTPDVQDTLLVSEFINLVVGSFGLSTLTASFFIEKDNAALDSAKTLKQCGVVANDNLKLCVVLEV